MKLRRFDSKSAAAFAVAAAVLLAGGAPLAGSLEAPQRMLVAQAGEKAAGDGVIKGVNMEEHKLMMAHGPIPALKWPAMTMAFGVAAGVDISALKPGDKVKFTLSRDAKGLYVIDQIQRAE